MEVKSLDPDVTVIGAGPAGLLAAKECADSGCHVIVYEEHKKVGEPDHCAGLLSSSGLRSLGLKLPERVIQNQVSGARIYSPAGTDVLIERGHREAFVVDRSAFDAWLAESAEDNDVQIRTSTRVKGLRNGDSSKHRLSLQSEGTTSDIQSSVVVNAEGFRCRISKIIGLPIVPKSSMYPAYQYEVRNAEVDDDLVEMYYGRHISSGFFLWNIPLGDGRARIGLASRDRAKIRLDAAMKHHPVLSQKLKRASIVRGFGGVVLVGMPIKRTYSDGVVVVGDAAGIVKATTGGGVILGGIAAKMAGKQVADAIQTGDVSSNFLRRYEERWQSEMKKELRMMFLAQKMISSLSDKGLDSLILDLKRSGLLETVRELGDMDKQSRTIVGLLRDPRTLLAGLRAIRYVNPLL